MVLGDDLVHQRWRNDRGFWKEKNSQEKSGILEVKSWEDHGVFGINRKPENMQVIKRDGTKYPEEMSKSLKHKNGLKIELNWREHSVLASHSVIQFISYRIGIRQGTLAIVISCRYSNLPSLFGRRSLCNRRIRRWFCVVMLLFEFFSGCSGFFHRTGSDLFFGSWGSSAVGTVILSNKMKFPSHEC